MAIENAMEGCVRETFGAMLAVRQAIVAGNGPMRSAMKSIARDETRHALLAWRVGAWLDRKLTAEQRRQVTEAVQQAVAQLARELARGTASSVEHFAGLPGVAEALQMLAELRDALWSAVNVTSRGIPQAIEHRPSSFVFCNEERRALQAQAPRVALSAPSRAACRAQPPNGT
jgi:hypothetical protein